MAKSPILVATYSFDLKAESIKATLQQKLATLLSITSALRIKAQFKLKILSRYIHAQMLFDIKLYDLPLTWVEQNLDALSLRYMRTWLEMPVSACVNEVAVMPRKMGGLGISSFKHLAQKMCLQKRHSLRASASEDVREIWKNTSTRHVATDQIIVAHD